MGNFDGIHLGHQEILKKVVERARQKNGISAALTFAEHPQRVLHHSQGPALLTSPQHRLLLLKELGIETVFLLSFTLPFSKISPEAFIEEFLAKRLRVNEVHLGYNARFGHNRSGDSVLMRRMSTQLGFEFFECSPIKLGNEFISSSLIREAIRKGDLEKAKNCLGRPFSLFASVVQGKGRGRTIGFPTANLQSHSEILPPHGVYPVEVRKSAFHLRPLVEGHEYEYQAERPGEWLKGILNYGVRPTFEKSDAVAIPEVFLFDFEGELYGKTVEVRFYPKIREEKAFETQEELVEAIKSDVVRAKKFLLSGKGS
ncbi:MAG: riboflavin biosynthesis protein RibF [Candidatus Omnitrophica bacterium]|nr:riboflavin biosynthesis protein RibF [Candidatus Omnitrophota bacterium]